MKNKPKLQILLGFALVGALAGCASSLVSPIHTLPKGDLVTPQALIQAHRGQYGCSDYDASTDSCQSLAKFRVSGNRVVSTEQAAARAPSGETEVITLVSQGRIEGNAFCVDGDDIRLGGTSSPIAEFAFEVTRQTVTDAQGVCATYYRSGDGYVVSSVGRNGEPYPPGDVTVHFFDSPKPIRRF